MHAYIKTYIVGPSLSGGGMLASEDTYTHTHTYIHTYIHTCMHAYTHTYIVGPYLSGGSMLAWEDRNRQISVSAR